MAKGLVLSGVRAVTLTEFLSARIAEDEESARGCPPWPWRVAEAADERDDVWANETVVAADGEPVAEPFALSGSQTRAVRDHIARHDPARVLAECEARRRIVADLSQVPIDDFDPETHPQAQWAAARTLRHLTLPYADHPDYRDEWKP